MNEAESMMLPMNAAKKIDLKEKETRVKKEFGFLRVSLKAHACIVADYIEQQLNGEVVNFQLVGGETLLFFVLHSFDLPREEELESLIKYLESKNIKVLEFF